MISTGRMMGAQEAFETGLINKIVNHEDFVEEVKSYVQCLVSGPGVAFSKVKELLKEQSNFEDGLKKEASAFSSLFATEDMKEGVAAFQEKRKPSFINK